MQTYTVFYTLDELRSAKQLLLLLECDKDGLADVISNEARKKRQKPNTEFKVAKDLLYVWEVVDR